MKTGKLLSACMMVKNEAHNIERCLSSIKGLVDEIVVVDTGSTDGTVEIAKKFGARIYHHPWQNDFSLHRNQSLNYATCKWVFIIDADEEFCLVNGHRHGEVRDLLSKIDGKFPASALTLKDIQKGREVMQFNSTRFFKRGKVHYEGIVHNQPQVDGSAVFNPYAYLKHYGYDLNPEQKKAKFERTKNLLLKQVEAGNLVDGLPYFYLCQLFAEYKDTAPAVGWGEKYWDMYERGEIKDKNFHDGIYFSMAKQYMKLGDQKKAYEWLLRGVDKKPGDLDLAMVAIEYGVWTNNTDLTLNAAKDYLKIYTSYEKDPGGINSKNFTFTLRPEVKATAQFYLVLLHLKQGMLSLKDLIGNLSTLPKPFMDGMLNDLSDQLKSTGLPISFASPKSQEQPITKQGVQNKPEFTTMSVH